MLRELAAGLESFSERDDVKVIALEANGKVFCGGMDIGEYTAERAFQMLDAFHAACISMIDITWSQ
jgi:enoyl-CoA hydratase/carnithine racemase